MTISATTLEGSRTNVNDADIASLRSNVRGELVVAGDARYDEARRVWNGNVDRRPGLIVRCTGAADVQQAVNFARSLGLLVSIRGGGHSAPGYGTNEGGLVIDLSPMRSVLVSADARTAHVAAGAWGAHVDAATQKHALATTLGQISNTGVAGLTLGGGFGWLSRRFGLACDNLMSVELVTADGKVRRVSERDEPDLFWAIRGGGGNFGVATSFDYRLHPLNPTVLAGHVDFPAAQVKDAIEFYVALIASAPRELSVDLSLEFNDDGEPGAQIYVVYSGDANSGGKVLEPLQRFGKPIKNTIAPTSYLAVQMWSDPPPIDPKHHYLKGGFVREYSSGLIKLLADEIRPDNQSSIYCQNANGAVADMPQTATAFSHRNAIANMMLLCQWSEPSQDEPGRAAARAKWSKLASFTDGYYVNLNDADPKGTDGNYGANFSRMATLKKQFDPMNLFRLNANIRPA